MELLLARAGALTATGQFAESHAALVESLDLAPQDSFALQTRLTTACASVEHLLGRHEEAHARLASALIRTAGSRVAGSGRTHDRTRSRRLYRMEYEPMREWAIRALEAARPLRDSPLTAAAAAVLTLAVAFTGDIAEAENSAWTLQHSSMHCPTQSLPSDSTPLRIWQPRSSTSTGTRKQGRTPNGQWP